MKVDGSDNDRYHTREGKRKRDVSGQVGSSVTEDHQCTGITHKVASSVPHLPENHGTDSITDSISSEKRAARGRETDD